MKENTIIIAADHAGFKLKQEIIQHLKEKEFKVMDMGCSNEEAVDYPDYAKSLCLSMKDNHKIGILICGSGIGMSICANRFNHIRAALCFTEEMAKLSRQHNNANVLILGARLITSDIAIKSIDTFLATSFIGEKHQKRIDKINN